MRLLFIWPGLTGYMGASWRALAKRTELRILVDGTGLGKNFSEAVMQGLDWRRVTEDEVIDAVAEFGPDALFLVGWRRRMPRMVAFSKRLADIPKIMVMDMPWRWSLRCLVARFVLRRYVRRFRGVLVHGVPSARYARWLGFAPERIHRHCICGIDVARFRGGGRIGRRRGFLFVGRHVDEKGIDTLQEAYGLYQRRGGMWPLSVPAWIDPEDVPRKMREHACLVLPSRWEPWGVVVAEAKAAGMKVIVSDRVGARFDIVCDAVFRAEDAEDLADRMREIEHQDPDVSDAPPDMSHWDCEAWAERVMDAVRKTGGWQ